MSGFTRGSQPTVLNRASLARFVAAYVAAELLPDPFDIADPCPFNAGGPHQPIPSCGDLACAHCSKVFAA